MNSKILISRFFCQFRVYFRVFCYFEFLANGRWTHYYSWWCTNWKLIHKFQSLNNLHFRGQFGKVFVKMITDVTFFYRNISVYQMRVDAIMKKLKGKKGSAKNIFKNQAINLGEIPLPCVDDLHSNYIEEIDSKRSNKLEQLFNIESTLRAITLRPFQLTCLLEKILDIGKNGLTTGQQEWLNEVNI